MRKAKLQKHCANQYYGKYINEPYFIDVRRLSWKFIQNQVFFLWFLNPAISELRAFYIALLCQVSYSKPTPNPLPACS
jgi:hypothetical protein